MKSLCSEMPPSADTEIPSSSSLSSDNHAVSEPQQLPHRPLRCNARKHQMTAFISGLEGIKGGPALQTGAGGAFSESSVTGINK